MLNIAVLGSTRGTDLQAIIDAIESRKLTGVKISAVISNKQDAYILERAKKYNLKAIFIDQKGKSKIFAQRHSNRFLYRSQKKHERKKI